MWKSGVKGIFFEGADLLERLASLIPPPRKHQLRYHGVYAPNSRFQAVVKRMTAQGERALREAARRRRHTYWVLWSEFLKRTFQRAFFDPAPEGVEDFEEGWANDLIFEEWSGAQLVVAPLGVGEIDGFETGWANDHYATAWEGVARVVGAFDGEQREDFEDQWGGKRTHKRALTCAP